MVWVVIIVATLLGVVVCAPVEVRFRVERHLNVSHRFGIRWLFGLVDTDLEGAPGNTAPLATQKQARASRSPVKSKRSLHVMAMLRSRGFLRNARRLMHRLVLAIGVRHVSVWLRAGFEDPADTGMLCAWSLPLVGALRASCPKELERFDVAPDFSRQTLRFRVAGEVRVIPAQLVGPVLAFGFSPRTIRGLMALRTGRTA